MVVPAHQAEWCLGACLDGFGRAGIPPGDVVVVDDGSTDATADIARRAGVRVCSGPRRGAAAARNAGVAAQRTGMGPRDAIVFVDADVVVAADAAAVIRDVLGGDAGPAAVFGAYDARPGAPGLVSRFRNLLHRHVHVANAGPAGTFWTGLGAVRLGAFDAVGGFDPDRRMMEDVAFGMALDRAGLAIVLDPRLAGTHLKAWTLAGMIRCDLLDRAIPWARLLRAEGAALPEGMNVGARGKISVLASGALPLGAALALAAPPAGAGLFAGALAVLVAANAPFLRRLLREAGPGVALAAPALLAVHYVCAGLGYAWVRATPNRPG